MEAGRIERFFLDGIKEHSDITVERGVMPETLDLEDADPRDREAHPITVTLRHLTEEQATPAESKGHSNDIQSGLFRSNLAKDDTDDILNAAAQNSKAGSTEVVKAKYMIGCDGAHSWVRRQLGFVMEGEQTDYIW
jgi:phenol 2-monooxygenase